MTKLQELNRSKKALLNLSAREIISNKDIRRISSKFIINPNNGCWEWIAHKNKKGYGTMGYKEKTVMSHRLIYQLFVSEIKDGYFICHHCDNPGCINPDHLFQGTAKDNNDDCNKKGRNPKVFSQGHVAHNATIEKRKAAKILLYFCDNPTIKTSEVAVKFNIPIQLAKDIKRGKSYSNLIEEFPAIEY